MVVSALLGNSLIFECSVALCGEQYCISELGYLSFCLQHIIVLVNNNNNNDSKNFYRVYYFKKMV